MLKSFIDSHCHLADPRIETEVESMIARAREQGITQFLQGGIGPEDWQLQKALKSRHPEVRLCFGLHPYWVSDHSDDECEKALDVLAREIRRAEAFGEVGLDFRPSVLRDDDTIRNRQIRMFENQIEMAEVTQKPLVLHVVRAFKEAHWILQTWGVPKTGGLVHSFNGSAAEAEKYLQLELHISVGGPVVRADNQKLHQAVQTIPPSRLLLETDSPDQPPPRLQGQHNEPASLWDVARMVGALKKMEAEEVLDISSQNLEKLLSYGNQSELQF